MTKQLRFLIFCANVLMMFVLIIIRQESQLAFGQLQELDKMQRIERQILNQARLDYINALNDVPLKAKQKGFVQREVRDGV